MFTVVTTKGGGGRRGGSPASLQGDEKETGTSGARNVTFQLRLREGGGLRLSSRCRKVRVSR